MATPLYLAVWNCLTPISSEEAAHQYQLLKDVGSERRFDDKVYAFYSRLIGLYPEVETLSEEELDDSPWASSMEVSDSHVITTSCSMSTSVRRRPGAAIRRLSLLFSSIAR